MRRRQIWAGAAQVPPPPIPQPEPSLEDQYEAKFGEKPHHRMKRETIIRKLRDDDPS